MDIEGGEFEALPSMSDFLKEEKPTLYLSLHPQFVTNPKERLEKIFKVVSMYNHIYDKQFREIGKDFIFDEERLKKGFEIVATDRSLN